MDKKMATILVLSALLVITGIGWFIAVSKRPYEGLYSWNEYFRGYEVYLDQRIYRGVMYGTSMELTIREGDSFLWVEVDNKAELRVSDIIVYPHPTYAGHPIVAHRITEVGVQGFWTKGDHLAAERGWVQAENVRGLVIGVVYQRRS